VLLAAEDVVTTPRSQWSKARRSNGKVIRVVALLAAEGG